MSTVTEAIEHWHGLLRPDVELTLVAGQLRDRERHRLQQRAHAEERRAVILDVGVVDGKA